MPPITVPKDLERAVKIPEGLERGVQAPQREVQIPSGLEKERQPFKFDVSDIRKPLKAGVVSGVRRLLEIGSPPLQAFGALQKEEEIFGPIRPAIQERATTESILQNFAILMAGEAVEFARPRTIAGAKGLGALFGALGKTALGRPVAEFLKRETPTLQKLFGVAKPKEVTPTTKAVLRTETPDFAANINLTKIDADQPVKQVLKATAKTIKPQIEAQTRGVIKNIETKQLASELGLTVQELTSKAPGTAANAETLLAARKLNTASARRVSDVLEKLRSVTPGSAEETQVFSELQSVYGQHAKIFSETSGLTAEVGRALQAQKIIVSGAEESAQQAVLESIISDKAELTLTKARVLADAVSQATPENVQSLINKFTRSTLLEKFEEFATAAKITNIATIERNIIGNQVMNMIRFAEKPIVATNEAFAKFFTGRPRQAFFGESFVDMFGQMRGAVKGFPKAVDAIISEEASLAEVARAGEALRVRGGMARIPGVLGKVIRAPFRLLTAPDALQSNIVREAEISTLAYRQVIREGLKGQAFWSRIRVLENNPTTEMLNQAQASALLNTFRLPLGAAGANIQRGLRNIPGSRLFIPFFRTIVNIGKQVARRTPPTSFFSPKNIADINAGGLLRSEALARIQFGLTGQSILTWLALNGYITPSASHFTKAERDALQRTGYQFSSVKIGERYFSYRNLEPMTLPLALAADTALSIQKRGEEVASKGLSRVVMSLGRNLVEQNFLLGLRDIIRAIDEPERFGERFVQNLVTGATIPTGLGQIARTIDPTLRDPEGILQALQARIPGLTKNVPPRRDAFGSPIRLGEQEGFFGHPLFRILSPSKTSLQRESRIEDELSRLDVKVGFPSTTIEGEKLKQREADNFLREIGETTKKAIATLLDNPFYTVLNDRQKKKMLERSIRNARDAIREKHSKKTGLDELSEKLERRLDNQMLGIFKIFGL